MTREELLAELSDNTYVMIKPSLIEGIGVFAESGGVDSAESGRVADAGVS